MDTAYDTKVNIRPFHTVRHGRDAVERGRSRSEIRGFRLVGSYTETIEIALFGQYGQQFYAISTPFIPMDHSYEHGVFRGKAEHEFADHFSHARARRRILATAARGHMAEIPSAQVGTICRRFVQNHVHNRIRVGFDRKLGARQRRSDRTNQNTGKLQSLRYTVRFEATARYATKLQHFPENTIYEKL